MPSEVCKVLWEYMIVKIGHFLFVSIDGIPPSSLEPIGTQDDNWHPRKMHASQCFPIENLGYELLPLARKIMTSKSEW